MRVEIERKRVEDIEERQTYEKDQNRAQCEDKERGGAFEEKIRDKIVRPEDEDYVTRVKVEERQRENLEMKGTSERKTDT